MAPEKRYQVRWDVYGALAAVKRPVGDGADNRVRCFLITVFTTSKSGATERNFIVRLTTFNLLDVRLSLDCELPIRKF